MVFCGEAKKVSIRFGVADADSSRPVLEALLTFLSPKDVCCLQVFAFTADVEIRFLARPAKANALVNTARRIAPGALIQIEDTNIVHAVTTRTDSIYERAEWEARPCFKDLEAANDRFSDNPDEPLRRGGDRI